MTAEQDKKIMTPIILGLSALACWLGGGVVLLLDACLGLGFGCPISGSRVPCALAAVLGLLWHHPNKDEPIVFCRQACLPDEPR